MSADSAEWFSVGMVLHHSDIDVLGRSLSSLLNAVEFLLNSHVDNLSDVADDARVGVYLLDNSLDRGYSSKVEVLLASLCSGIDTRIVVNRRLLDENLGYGAANNTLLPSVSSRFHLVLNPDVYLARDALVRAFEYLASHSDVVMLSPCIDGGHVIKSYPDCLTLGLRYLGSQKLSRLFYRRLERYSRTDLRSDVDASVQIIGGCFMLMSTDSWRTVDGFDSRFFMYFEDFDLSLRMAHLGRLAYVPQVKVRHEGGDVGRKAFAHHRYFAVSMVRFFNKHGWKLF